MLLEFAFCFVLFVYYIVLFYVYFTFSSILFLKIAYSVLFCFINMLLCYFMYIHILFLFWLQYVYVIITLCYYLLYLICCMFIYFYVIIHVNIYFVLFICIYLFICFILKPIPSVETRRTYGACLWVERPPTERPAHMLEKTLGQIPGRTFELWTLIRSGSRGRITSQTKTTSGSCPSSNPASSSPWRLCTPPIRPNTITSSSQLTLLSSVAYVR